MSLAILANCASLLPPEKDNLLSLVLVLCRSLKARDSGDIESQMVMTKMSGRQEVDENEARFEIAWARSHSLHVLFSPLISSPAFWVLLLNLTRNFLSLSPVSAPCFNSVPISRIVGLILPLVGG